MSYLPIDVRPFARRVRLVRAWRGLAGGLLVGGSLSLVWALFDLMGWFFTEWQALALLCGSSALLSASVCAAWPVNPKAVAKSVDRRARLRDRIGTAIERQSACERFDEALRKDALASTSSLKASALYPVKLGRWQYLALCSLVLASAVFLLGNAWPILSPEAKREKEELQRISQDIERVAKPIVDRKDATGEETAFAKNLQDFAKRLEKGRIDKETAMQRANELADQAQKLADKRAEQSVKRAQTAREQMSRSELASKGIDEKALDILKKDAQRSELLKKLEAQLGQPGKKGDERFSQAALDEMGLGDLDPSLLNMDEGMRDSIEKYLQERMKEIEEALKGQNLSQDQRNALNQELESLEALQQELQISEEARRILQEFMNSPEYQDIMKEVAKLRKAAKQVSEGTPLTKEQIEALEKGIEALAQKLKDSKYRDEVLEAMRAALEQLKTGNALCDAAGT